MAFGLNDFGERDVLDVYFNSQTFNLTLYNDSTDQLSDVDGLGAISTEPQGSNYTRADVTNNDVSVSTSNGDAVLSISSQPFDVSDSTQNVDAYALIDADGNLVHRGPIDTSDREVDYIDLDQNDDLLIGGDPITLG